MDNTKETTIKSKNNKNRSAPATLKYYHSINYNVDNYIATQNQPNSPNEN